MSKPSYLPLTLNVAGKLSPWLGLEGKKAIGFITPANLVSTALTFNMTPSQAANPIVSVPVKNSASSTSFTVTTSTYYGFTQDQMATFEGVENIQANCGTSEAQGVSILLVVIPRQSI